MLLKSSTKLILQLSFIILISVACDRQKGSTIEATAAEQVDPVANATKLEIDTAMSIITWIGTKPTDQHDGIISISDGYAAVDKGKLVGGVVNIDIRSLHIMDIKPEESGYTKLKKHLMSDDFFDADNYPTGSFTITEVMTYDSAKLVLGEEEFESEYTPASLTTFMVKNPTHILSGNLTLRGVTKNISFPASIIVSEESVKAEAKFNIDRTNWNLSYDDESSVIDRAKDKFIYNTVNVGFNLETR
ncbi:MAG: YceI family protein [Marinoscillum sp.]